MMLARLRIVPHFVVGRMIRVHVLEFAMRTGADPVTDASGVSLRTGRDETAIAMMAMLRGEGAGRGKTNRRQRAQIYQPAQKRFTLKHYSLSPVCVDCAAVRGSLRNQPEIEQTPLRETRLSTHASEYKR